MTPAALFLLAPAAAALWLVVWAKVTRRARFMAAGLFFAALLFIPVVEGLTLSRPLPLDRAWWFSGEAEVLSFQLQENVAIYLWIVLEGDPQPRYFSFPWDKVLAQGLLDAQEQGKGEGNPRLTIPPYEPSLETRRPIPYPAPQPKTLPDKPLLPAPEMYEQPASFTPIAAHLTGEERKLCRWVYSCDQWAHCQWVLICGD